MGWVLFSGTRPSEPPATPATPAERLLLHPHEVAFVLQITRSEVLGAIGCGRVRDVSHTSRPRIAAEDASELVIERMRAGNCSALAGVLLERIRLGRLSVRRDEIGALSHEQALQRSRMEPP